MELLSWPGHFRNLGLAQPELALPRLISDDYHAGSSWVFIFGANCWTKGLPLGKGTQRRRMRNLMGAGCALALACVCAPLAAIAQQPAADSTPTGVKTDVKTGSAPAKAHPHPASNAPKATHAKSSAAATAHSSKSKSASLRKKGRSKTTTARGQQKIDPERAQEIQQALIREHYLNGEASVSWNQASEDAMRRYQADHGWQSKTVPDSRALISLGLGPSHDHLLNPESAMTMTSGPEASRSASAKSAPQNPVPHSAESGTRMNTNSSAPAVDGPPASTTPHDAAEPQ
jgi:hypothetical protein